jgi:hypothetical protein
MGLQVNTDGRLKYRMFKNIVCKLDIKAANCKKPGVNGRIFLYNWTPLRNI